VTGLKKLILIIIIFTFMGMLAAFTMDNNTTTGSGIVNKVNKEDMLTKIAESLVSNLENGNYKEAIINFDDTMRAQVSADKLETIWKTLLSQCGNFKEEQGTRYEAIGDYDAIYVICNFEKLVLDIKVVFNKDSQISGLSYTPAKQTTVDTTKIAESVPESVVEASVTVGSGEWALPGTLSMPKGEGPFPVVILVHGSGPNDRDETIGQNKPFRDLAWGLANKGIAVLRYDKRTKVYADKMRDSKTITVKEETIDDVTAAVALMQNTKGIDKRKIYVLGHSLGGMLIPRIAEKTQAAAGYIVMAGSARHLEDIILEQYQYILSLDKVTTKSKKDEIINSVMTQVTNIKNLKPNDSKTEKELLGVPASYWLDLKDYNPAKAAKSIKKPMLILQGERDYQVTLRDFNIWKLNLSSNKNVTLKTYKDLNHLFMTGKGKSTPEEYNLEGHVSQNVIDDICSWVKKQK
jgi:uncharacterized protein